MAQTLPTTEPTFARAGDTIAWRRSLADYPAPTWVLKYRLINAAEKIDITATADGSDHLISQAASTTATWEPGDYEWMSYVEGGTSERYTVASGRITLRPNLAAASTGYEARSTARKALDDLRAALATWIASNGQVQEYEIAGRRMKYASSADIRARISLLEREVAREDVAEKLAAGQDPGRRLLVRF